MADDIIAHLLSLPVLNFSETSREEAKDFEFLLNKRAAYEQQISEFVSSEAFTLNVKEACVDILLRFFNAANFVGDISVHESEKPSSAASVETENARLKRAKDSSSAQLAAKLEGLAPQLFAHFKCSDRQEMPPSAFAVVSKTGAIPNREDEAEGASKILPPEPYRYLLRSLSVDGEVMEVSVRRCALLAAAVAIAKTLPSSSIWRVRALFRHQLSLAHRSNSLYTALMESIKTISSGDIPKSQAPGLAVEMAHIYAFYHRPDGAQQFLQQAIQTSGLLLKEDAFHGIRTKHMQHEVPQLILSAASATVVETDLQKTWEQPSVIQSESSGFDILDRPRKLGSTEEYDGAKPLLLRDYAIILALCSHLKQSNAEHGLTTHQGRLYTERLMIEKDGSVPWVFKAHALLLRARFEYGKNRVQERAFLQYQELIDSVVPEGAARLVRAAFYGEDSQENTANSLFYRLERCDPNSGMFYAIAWPSHWSLRREYGERCFEDSLFKTALELFELTLDWPNIIKCCRQLDRRNKAASLAEDLLKEDPNDVMLWVALGEAKRDEEPLLHAWKLCKGLMAAPMRSLARLALSRERYEDVVKYFDQSVKINPIFGGDWFSLGFAALRLQKQNRASEAFTRVCQIDPEDAYAWSNLAAILVREKKLRPAFNATSQALRNAPNDWRMWDNYFKIGVEIKEVTESAHALRRVIAGVTHGSSSNIAKYEPEYESLSNFVKIVLQYIRGEIEATENDISTTTNEERKKELEQQKREENAGEEITITKSENGGVVVSLDSVEGAEKLRVPAFAVGAATAGEDLSEDSDANAAANAGLKPLFADLDNVNLSTEIEKDSIYKTPEELEKRRKEYTAQVRRRFEKSTRQLLLQIGGTFTSFPQVHAAVAEFFGALDGPQYEFVWRVKQVRETMQEPLWERTREKLQVVIDAASAMTKAAIAAEKEMKEKKSDQTSSVSVSAAAASSQNNDDSNNNNQQSSSSSSEDDEEKKRKQELLMNVSPKRDTMQTLNHILEKATPHFEDPEILRPIQVCLMKLKKSG